MTGRPPFQAATAIETLSQVVSDEPAAPRRLNPSVPRDVETICLKCLEKEPGKRYASASALADDLRRYLVGAPILARPIGGGERVWKWIKRRPVVSGLAAFSAAAAIGLIVGGIWFNWRLRSANATLAHTNSRLDQANTALGQSNRQLSDSLDETKLQRERAIRNLYAADMDRARRAVDGGLTSRALELLNGFQNPDPGLPDLRGFEWYYLHKLCSGGMRTIDAGGGVSCVAASSDGRLLAGVMGSPAEDKPMTLRIWDAATGRALHTLNGHQDMIMRVAFDTTGKKLASAGWDGTARIWDTATGKQTHIFKHKGAVNGVAFHPEGRRLAACGGSLGMPTFATAGFVKLWDTESSQEAVKIEGHQGFVHAVALSRRRQAPGYWQRRELAERPVRSRGTSPAPEAPAPRGQQAGRAERWGEVKIWNAANGHLEASVAKYGQSVMSLDFSPDGTRLAASSAGAPVTLFGRRPVGNWSRSRGPRTRRTGLLRWHFCPTVGLRWPPKQEIVRLVDAATGRVVKTLQGHTAWVSGVVPRSG